LKIFERISIVFRALFSNNVILIYDIKQRIEGGKYRIITKTQRHTNLTVYEDIEAIEDSLNKVVNKAVK
jgi:hypothetical protein